MKASLKIEFIGADAYQYLAQMCKSFDALGGPGFGDRFIGRPKNKPWVAEITGYDDIHKLHREFVRAQWDYSEANKRGSRGVHLYFILESNKIYEVFRFISWKCKDRYFCAVNEDGSIYRLSEDEVKEWLNAL